MQQLIHHVDLGQQDKCSFCSGVLLQSTLCHECKKSIQCTCKTCRKKIIVDFHAKCMCSSNIILDAIESYIQQILILSLFQYNYSGLILNEIKSKEFKITY